VIRSAVRAALWCLILAATMHAGPAAAGPVDGRALAARLYAAGPPPPWHADGGAVARLALGLLGDAGAHGLDPANYGTGQLARRIDALGTAADAAAFERALSTAMLQYLADLRAGRTPSP